MTNILAKAFEKAAKLSQNLQDEIGEQLLEGRGINTIKYLICQSGEGDKSCVKITLKFGCP